MRGIVHIKILSSFLSFFLSDTSSSTPGTEPAFLMSLLNLLPSAAPAHYSVQDDAGHHRVRKHLHGAADVERSESPEKKNQAALTFVVQSIVCLVQLDSSCGRMSRYLYYATEFDLRTVSLASGGDIPLQIALRWHRLCCN